MSEPTDNNDNNTAKTAGPLKWVVIAVGVLAALLMIVLATRDSGVQRRSSSSIVGELAPAIVGVTNDGEDFDLDNWRGRWVLVNFFSTTCVPCIVEHPELIEFHERRADDGAVVSVVFDDTPERVRDFFERNGGDWPVVAEGYGQVAVAYGVTGVPESYLVAPSGVVVWKQLGGVTADGIDAVIEQLTTS